MSDIDFNGRLFAPVMARPRRPLSNKASTDSCSIRFSLRTIISGALNSIRRLRRLFLLMTRRYRSLRSEVAKRPPSRGTSGRNSGGITGTTSKIIHSGLAPELINASTSLSRLTNFFRLASDFVSFKSLFSISYSSVSSIRSNIKRIASAPIPA